MRTGEMVHVEHVGHSAQHMIGARKVWLIAPSKGGSWPAFLKEMLPRHAPSSGKLGAGSLGLRGWREVGRKGEEGLALQAFSSEVPAW